MSVHAHASAPGKVLLTGGYLVLRRAFAGVVLAASARFAASARLARRAAGVLRVHVHAPQLRQCIELEFDGATLRRVAGPHNPFVEAAVAMAALAADARGECDVCVLGDNDFYSQHTALAERRWPYSRVRPRRSR